MDQRRPAAVAAIALLLTLPLTASADVDVELRNGDGMRGTLSPADEVETIRARIPAGARVSVLTTAVRSARTGHRPGFTVQVAAPGGGSPDGLRARGGRTRGRLRFTAPQTGTYSFRVLGGGDHGGDYSLRLRWRQRARIPFAVDLDGDAQVPFVADPGSIATVSVRAARRSAARPRIARIAADDGAAVEGFPAPARPGGRAHLVRNVRLSEGPALVLTVSDAGDGGGGPITGRITLRAGPRRPVDLDLTQDGIGRGFAAGNDFARGTVAGPGGAELRVDPDDSPLYGGASVVIPEDHLATAIPVFVGSAPPIPENVIRTQGGPTVQVGPADLLLLDAVTVTIPVDGSVLEEPATLRVLARAADGRVRELAAPLYQVDAEAGTVSFPTTTPGSFAAFAATVPDDVEVVGDVNGDGASDLVVRAPAADANRGKVYLFFGPLNEDVITADADTVIEGDEAFDVFGAVTLLRDLDDDGKPELLVGADGAEFDDGAVFVYRDLAPGLTLGTVDAAAVLSGPANGSQAFGVAIDVGDVDGDGAVDILVGAEDAGGFARGAAYVFLGDPLAEFPFSDRAAGGADIKLNGRAGGDLFGSAVAIADVTGDGAPDVIVAADQADSFGKGLVHVWEGPLDPRNSPLSAANSDGLIVGEYDDDGLGLPLTTGDLDLDGTADLVIGAPFHDPDENAFDRGAVYVFFGGPLLTSRNSADEADRILLGTHNSDFFGTDVRVGDVTADRVPDLITSSYGGDGPPFNSGLVHVCDGIPGTRGAFGQVRRDFHGQQALDLLSVVEEPVDVDGDGFTDMVVTAPGNVSGGSGAGRLYVVFGAAAIPDGISILDAALSVTGGGFVVTGAIGEYLGAESDAY